MNVILEDILSFRNFLSKKFIFGNGIEIGALHTPIKIYNQADVRYVDRFGLDKLQLHYPGLSEEKLIEPDIIDNGELLSKFEKGSLDFIVANHMLEHCENPLGSMRVHLQRLKKGGVCFYPISDKRVSFDCDREKTEFDHLVHDDEVGPESSRTHHYEEWVEKVCKICFLERGIEKFKWHEGLRNLLIDRHLESLTSEQLRVILDDMNYSIHFHVWDSDSFLEFIINARAHLENVFSIICCIHNQSEIIAILKKI